MLSIEKELDILKMVILIEQDPLTDKFEQMMFTQEQYKAITGFIASLVCTNKCPDGHQSCFNFTTSDRYKNILIPNIPHTYTQGDLENPLK